VLKLASAALAEVLTEGLAAQRRGFKYFFNASSREVLLELGYSH
jgi:hypothetical protein